MSEFFLPFLHGAGVLVASVTGFLFLEFAGRVLTDRLTASRAG